MTKISRSPLQVSSNPIVKCVSILVLIINHHVSDHVLFSFLHIYFFFREILDRFWLFSVRACSKTFLFTLKSHDIQGITPVCETHNETDETSKTCTHLFRQVQILVTGTSCFLPFSIRRSEMWNHRRQYFFWRHLSPEKREKNSNELIKKCQFKETFKHWPWMIPENSMVGRRVSCTKQFLNQGDYLLFFQFLICISWFASFFLHFVCRWNSQKIFQLDNEATKREREGEKGANFWICCFGARYFCVNEKDHL